MGNIIGGAPVETCQALQKKGFVGMSPIRRPTKSLRGHMDDVMAAVTYLKRLNYVDPNRIGILGFSRGGMLTYQAAARYMDFKAVVIMATAMGKGGRVLDLNEAGNINAPILVLVAKNDTGSRRTGGMNTLSGTKKIVQAMESADRNVKLLIYPPYCNDGHTLFFTVGPYFKDITAFFSKHL